MHLSEEQGRLAEFSAGAQPQPARPLAPRPAAGSGALHSHFKRYLSVQKYYTHSTENREELKENNPNPVTQAKAITTFFFFFFLYFFFCVFPSRPFLCTQTLNRKSRRGHGPGLIPRAWQTVDCVSPAPISSEATRCLTHGEQRCGAACGPTPHGVRAERGQEPRLLAAETECWGRPGPALSHDRSTCSSKGMEGVFVTYEARALLHDRVYDVAAPPRG